MRKGAPTYSLFQRKENGELMGRLESFLPVSAMVAELDRIVEGHGEKALRHYAVMRDNFDHRVWVADEFLAEFRDPQTLTLARENQPSPREVDALREIRILLDTYEDGQARTTQEQFMTSLRAILDGIEQ